MLTPRQTIEPQPAGEVLLIRHGESEANIGLPSDTPQGIPLTAWGHQQARQLAESLPAPDLIAVSSYRRACQTAEPSIRLFSQALVETWEVHEFTYLNPVFYAGTTEAERGRFAKDYWQRCDPLWNDGGGAESFADLIARIDRTLEKLRQMNGRRVHVFTHGYFIKALLLRSERPRTSVDEALMALFRDGRKINPVPNSGVLRLLTSPG